MTTKFYLTILFATWGLISSFAAHSLQALSDAKLAQVVGQSRGLNITSEQNVDIASVTYTDEDGVGNAGLSGNLSLNQVKVRNTPNQPVNMDLEIKDYNGKKAVWLTLYSMQTSMQVENLSINNKSLGGFGQSAIQMAANDTLSIRIYAGGQSGNGLTLDMLLPTSLTFDSYYTDDGTQLTQTLVLKDPNSSNRTLNLEGITLDLANNGMRVSLPELTNGYLAMQNMTIGNSVFGSSILRHINLKKGAYLIIKNAKNHNEKGMEIDASIKQGSNFELASITGKITNNTPAANSYESTAKITLLEDLNATGMRMNVDGNRGLVFDFAGNNGAGGIRGKIQIDDIYMRKTSQANLPNQASFGRAVLDMNVGAQTYLQVEGH